MIMASGEIIMGKIFLFLIKYFFVAFLYFYGAMSFAEEMIPDFYRDAGLSGYTETYNDSPEEVIDPFTGVLRYFHQDISLPGNGGFNLSVMRSYDTSRASLSNLASGSGAGLGWTVHFGRVLKKKIYNTCSNNFVSVTNNPILETQDGNTQVLAEYLANSSELITASRWKATCNSNGYTVYSPSGIRYDMTQYVSLGDYKAWYTTKITDHNGNYANITYKSYNNSEIDSINTSDGRKINFYYTKGSSDLTSRISEITVGSQSYMFSYSAIPNLGIKEYWLSKVTMPDGKSWNYEYNGDLNGEAGYYALKKVTYPLGSYITYDYDNVEFYSDGNVFINTGTNAISKRYVSTGDTWSYTYAPSSSWGNYDMTTVSTPKGNIVYQHIGANTVSNGNVWAIGLLVSKKTGDIQTESYSYSSQKISSQNNQRQGLFYNKIDNGYYTPILTQKKISRSGQDYTTSYSQHDAYGNPGVISESGSNGGNRTTSLTYYINTPKWIIHQINSETRTGTSIIREFYADGNLKSISNNGIETNYSYDSEGNISSVTDPRNIVYNYSNYKRGIPQNENQPEYVNISRVVDYYGNITSETNGENETTNYHYDSMNRVSLIDFPLGNNKSITYSGNKVISQRGNYIQTITYDGFGRVEKVDDGNGVYVNYDYDSMGMRSFTSNPGSSNIGKHYTYDILSRLTNIRFADENSATISYNGANVSYKDQKGYTRTYKYRAYGDPDIKYLVGVTTPVSSANITYQRNNRDLIESMVQSGITRTYTYYNNNYLKSITNPETGVTIYGRDNAGNITSIKVGNMPVTNFTYDDRNRLENTIYPSGTPSASREYDKADRLQLVENSQIKRTFEYDDNGNLTEEWWWLTSDGSSYRSTNTYNANDQLESITYPMTGNIVQYELDSLGRTTSIGNYINLVNYWPSGKFREITYSNGITSSFGEDTRLLVNKIKVTGNASFIDNNYLYDKNGNLEKVDDLLGANHDRALTYDAIDRISSAAGSWGAGSFSYGATGRLSNKKLGSITTTYNYGTSNKLQSISGTRSSPVAYDGYGNITELFGKNFIFDAASNLSCEDCDSDNESRQHYYDGLNQRYQTIHNSDTQYEFYNADGLLLSTYSPTKDNQTVEYIYLNGKRIAQHVTDDVTTTQLQVKALLQGAYDTSSGLMRDDLRTKELIPTDTPYPNTQQSLNVDLLNNTGGDAIVDWVLLELRAANNPSNVEHAYAALLQRDGDLVDPVSGDVLLLDNITGSFYISLRHRNHLGVITANPLNLTDGGVSIVDFTSTNILVMGQDARREVQGKALMWAGDANHDEKVISQGIGNDPSKLLADVLLAPGNSSFSSNYIVEGYLNSDINLDGKTIYSGPGSDNNIITSNIMLHPGNSGFSSNYIIMGGMVSTVSQ